MDNITVNLITNKQKELKKFLTKYFQDENYIISDTTFRWTGIYTSALNALDLIIVAAEADEDYLIQIVVNLPEFDAVINHKNLNDFIRYIYFINENTNTNT